MRGPSAARCLACLFLLWPVLAWGGADLFRPDPAAVERYGTGYRYPQEGWWVVHVEGEPHARGVQHGHLMADEIAAYIRCFAADYSHGAPEDAWRLLRMVTASLFLSRFEREYLEEMQGIADGATAAGAKFDGRPLDLTDIATLNLWPEIMTLPGATEALPTGLEGRKFPDAPARPSLPPPLGRCSAFAATGPATADGKVVFGHISMFNLYPSTFFNVWLDVAPSQGHRVLMQTVPGGISSGMDYYMNDAGILVSETTLNQTRLEAAGAPQAGRIRKALQYCTSIDQVVETLRAGNNGLYTNEWLMADIKTNEIAMFELGTHASRLYRSSKGDWFGGTPGFYWGCNNTKDIAVRLETIASTDDRPENMVWHPSPRDEAWIGFYRRHKGKIGIAFAKEAFTTPPLCAFSSLDAKFTTTDLAGQLTTWALFGPPRGKTWTPTDGEKRDFPEVEPLVSNPWTILHGEAPAPAAGTEVAVDLREESADASSSSGEGDDDHPSTPVAPEKLVWRGTILPRSDADIWLASAFGDYHQTAAREKGLLALSKSDSLSARDLSELGTRLYAAKARYLFGARAGGDMPLARLRSDDASRDWYRIASGKGVLALNELRWRLGDEKFVAAMDGFGVAHAGKDVAWGEFAAEVARASGEKLDSFFEYWVQGTGLPKLGLAKVELQPPPSSGVPERTYRIEGVVTAEGGPPPLRLEMSVETAGDEVTRVIPLAPSGAFSLEVDREPKRLIADKYCRMAKANGGRFDVVSFLEEIDKTLIVYGTADDEAGNRDAATVLQERLRMISNFAVPVVTDAAASDEELRSHHLLLIGRPQANRVTQRLRESLPVDFGAQSFRVGGDLYAHPGSAVIAAGPNPLSPRYGMTLFAGLGALSTYRVVEKLGRGDAGAEVKIVPRGGREKKLVVPPAELVHEFRGAERASRAGRQ